MEYKISMRHVFAVLVAELGQKDGVKQFEWYCKTYKVTACDMAPASVVREVFGA